MRKKIRIEFGLTSIILVVVCAVLTAADLITKTLAVHLCEDSTLFAIIPGRIYIGPVIRNYGAAFSFMSGRSGLLIALTSVMVLLLIAAFIFLPERFKVMKTAVVFIVAGALGNLIDRIAYGCVRDFIHDEVITNTTLNIADLFVTIGVIIAIIDILFFNEWAVFPLTKRARAVQAERREKEAAQKAEKEAAKMAKKAGMPYPPEDAMTEEGTDAGGLSPADPASERSVTDDGSYGELSEDSPGEEEEDDG